VALVLHRKVRAGSQALPELGRRELGLADSPVADQDKPLIVPLRRCGPREKLWTLDERAERLRLTPDDHRPASLDGRQDSDRSGADDQRGGIQAIPGQDTP
jgi:hypothetical protein